MRPEVRSAETGGFDLGVGSIGDRRREDEYCLIKPAYTVHVHEGRVRNEIHANTTCNQLAAWTKPHPT